MKTLSGFFDNLSPLQMESILRDWPLWLHPPQKVPPGHWRTWLLMGGRGGGKTRAGAEWMNAIANRGSNNEGDQHYLSDTGGRVALIGETFHDVRAVMIEGKSGLLATSRRDRRPVWHVSRRQLEWPNGTIGQVFSATDPDGLRGSQFGAAWCDVLLSPPPLHLPSAYQLMAQRRQSLPISSYNLQLQAVPCWQSMEGSPRPMSSPDI